MDTSDRRAAAERILGDAGSLLERVAAIWRDELDVSGGTGIVYAVDVDVIMMYADPDGNTSYGAVLSDAADVSPLVTSLLGEYIFHRGFTGLKASPDYESKDPLLLFSEHAQELKGRALALSSAQYDEVLNDLDDPGKRDLLREELASLDREASIDTLMAFVTERASRLTRMLLGRSKTDAAIAQLARLAKGPLLSIANHPAFSGAGALLVPPERGDPSEKGRSLAGRADEWLLSMQQDNQRSSARRSRNFAKDAWVLASLEAVNRDAVERELDRRVVLITGTSRIFEAASREPAAHAGFADFASAYLRDPRALMGLEDFFTSTRHRDSLLRPFRLADWLSILFPNSILERSSAAASSAVAVPSLSVTASSISNVREIVDHSSEALDILIGEGTERKGNFPDDVLEQWRDIVRDTHVQRVLTRDDNEWLDVLRSFSGLDGKTFDDRLDAVVARIAERAARSFAGLYLATGVIGVVQLLDRNARIRGLPALRFDGKSFPVAQQLYDRLSDELFKREGRAESFDLRLLYDELIRSEESHYHAFVLFAYVYASTGRWSAAKALCRSALVVAKTMPRVDGEPASGREAAYFLAVAERRVARDARGLRQSADALALARKRDLLEGEHRSDDPRFASEELALAFTRWQAAFFEDENPDPANLFAYLRSAEEVCRLAKRAGEPRGVRAWVVRQSCTNGLIAALFALELGRHTPQLVGQARDFISTLSMEALAPNLDAEDGAIRYQDEVSDFIWLVAVARFDATRSAAARRELESYQPPRSDRVVVPFEIKRFHLFLRIVGIERADAPLAGA